MMEWDVFISHASEDKDDFVRHLADRLRRTGLRVWFDEFTLTVGDSLRRSIDRGLTRSRYGIVVVSPNFLQKNWPQRELDGLVARENDGVKVILPIWHNIGADEIRGYSPTLADRLAVSSSKGIDHVISQLMQAIQKDDAARSQIAPVAVSVAGSPSRLAYLTYRDSELEPAIVSAAQYSAYGRWFAAQILVNSGHPIQQRHLVHVMASQVMDKMLDGEIDVRGRRHGQMDYEIIPRTYWRSTAFHVVADPLTLWKVVLCPRGGAEIAPDGTIAHASNATAAARNSQLTDYDSLLVDAYQFEQVWPTKERIADKKRREFLRQARKRDLDSNEIKRLS